VADFPPTASAKEFYALIPPFEAGLFLFSSKSRQQTVLPSHYDFNPTDPHFVLYPTFATVGSSRPDARFSHRLTPSSRSLWGFFGRACNFPPLLHFPPWNVRPGVLSFVVVLRLISRTFPPSADLVEPDLPECFFQTRPAADLWLEPRRTVNVMSPSSGFSAGFPGISPSPQPFTL